MIALVQAGMQANQLASASDHAGNINFLKTKKKNVLFFVSAIKKVYQRNIPFMRTIHIMYVFIKGIIRKTNCHWHVHFFFNLY